MNSTINSKHTLLLVDDERLVLATLAQGLSKAGYSVSTAESVDEAEATVGKWRAAGSGYS